MCKGGSRCAQLPGCDLDPQRSMRTGANVSSQTSAALTNSPSPRPQGGASSLRRGGCLMGNVGMVRVVQNTPQCHCVCVVCVCVCVARLTTVCFCSLYRLMFQDSVLSSRLPQVGRVHHIAPTPSATRTYTIHTLPPSHSLSPYPPHPPPLTTAHTLPPTHSHTHSHPHSPTYTPTHTLPPTPYHQHTSTHTSTNTLAHTLALIH